MSSTPPERPDKRPLLFEEVYPLPRPIPNTVADSSRGGGSRASSESSESDLKNDLTDVDLYCLHCGYNLRGLSGDPRRCPECGQLSSLSELTLPAEMITRQLQRMESAPTGCVALALLMLVALLTSLLVLVELGLSATGFVASLFCLVMTGPLVALWRVSVDRFRSACMGKPGWSEVLFEYHLHGLGVCLILIFSFAPLLFFGMRHHASSPWPIRISEIVLFAGCASVVAWAPGIRRRCKAKMDILQREVAVKIAGEHLRERLSRRHW